MRESESAEIRAKNSCAFNCLTAVESTAISEIHQIQFSIQSTVSYGKYTSSHEEQVRK